MTPATPQQPQRYTNHTVRHKQSISPAPQQNRSHSLPTKPPTAVLRAQKGVDQLEEHNGENRGEVTRIHTPTKDTKKTTPPLAINLPSRSDRMVSGLAHASGSQRLTSEKSPTGEDGVPRGQNIPGNRPSDPEKQSYTGYQISSEVTYLTLSNDSEDTLQIGSGADTAEKANEVERTLKMTLVYLSIFSPCITIFVSIYSLLALSTLLLTDPIRFCTFREPLSKLISNALLPPIRFQLETIHSFCPTAPQPSTPTLILICLTSPIYAIAISVAAWVVGVFWFFAAILGEPNPSGEKDNDGRAAGLGVRRWWEKWLQRAVGC